MEQFELKSPYGYLTPKFDKKPVWNGAIGTVQKDGRVKFDGLREAVDVPRHWRKQMVPSQTAKASMIVQLLLAEGYRLIDDASGEHGRLTFLHGENPDRPFYLALSHTLRYAGLQIDPDALRTFRLPGYVIEIEPGGAETSGHYLHLIETSD
jgi:hypothetical protein